jgi:hypothetical protein
MNYATKVESLVAVLHEAHIQKTRIRIRYDFGAEVEGYVTEEDGPEKRAVVAYNVRSIHGQPIQYECVKTVGHANKRRGGQLWPLP